MQFTFIICSFFVGSALVPNADSTHLLGLLGGNGFNPFQQGREMFEEFFSIIPNIFGHNKNGFNHFLDEFIRGIPSLFEKSFGVSELDTFLGPLSQLPDNADLPALLGEKFKGKADKFGLLVELAKKFCLQGKCDDSHTGEAGSDKKNISGKDSDKILQKFLGSYQDQLIGGLGGFHSGLEGLISSYNPNKENDIFRSLSKLPEVFDPLHILGKHGSSHSVDGIFSRKDILPILVKLAKSKCSTGCDKS